MIRAATQSIKAQGSKNLKIQDFINYKAGIFQTLDFEYFDCRSHNAHCNEIVEVPNFISKNVG
jgi:hypothetical protein